MAARKNMIDMTREEYEAAWDAMVRAENARAERERRDDPRPARRTGFRLLPSEHVG